MYVVSLRSPNSISSVLKTVFWRNWGSVCFWLSCEASAHVLASIQWTCCSPLWLRRCAVRVAIPTGQLLMKGISCWQPIGNNRCVWLLAEGTLLSQKECHSGWPVGTANRPCLPSRWVLSGN